MNQLRKQFLLISFCLLLAGMFSLLSTQGEARPLPSPSWPAITLSEVASGFSSPVHLTHAWDGSGHMFVVERNGIIKILGGGTFLDISSIVQGGGEEGLLSVAFPPNYSTSGHFYVYFTDARTENAGNYDNVLARFSVSAGDPNVADPASEEILMVLEHPIESNHNGGQIAFGPEGYLYIATGDGGGGGDPYENAQDLGSELGNILRIDVGGAAIGPPPPPPGPYVLYLPLIMKSGGLPYLVPPDNPFVDDPAALDEIWAYGLRNPWRFSFDRSTGDLWIGDVGQGAWEEIDYRPAASIGGENYGWDCREGAHDYEFDSGCTGVAFTEPVFEYANPPGECRSVTGGFVYRGTAIPSLQGIYLYADYCSGQIWGLQNDSGSWVSQELTNGGFGLASFGENEAGELFLARLDGKIFQVVEATP